MSDSRLKEKLDGMTRVFVLCGFLLLCTIGCRSVQAQLNCIPVAAKEGEKQVTLPNNYRLSPIIGKSYSVMWTTTRGGEQITIYNDSRVLFEDKFNVTDPPYRGLILLNVNRSSEAEYQCYIDEQMVFNCFINVYNILEKPTCTPLAPRDNTYYTTCGTDKVYPKAKCEVFVGTTLINSSIITYSHATVSKEPVYYSTKCDIRFDMVGMTRGNNTFHVNMFPDVIGLRDDTSSSSRVGIGDVDLTVPTVSILPCENVHDGYYMWDRSNCTCVLDTPGEPRGLVQWTRSNGRPHIVAFSDNSSTVRVNSPGTYTCSGMSDLKGPYDSQSISLLQAYGPPYVEIDFIDVDHTTDGHVTVICVVDRRNVQPALTFELVVSKDSGSVSPLDPPVPTNPENYTQAFVVQPSSSGVQTLTCVARNSKFGHQLFATKSLPLVTTVQPAESSSDSSDLLVGVAVGAGGVIVIIVIIVIILYIARRRGWKFNPFSKESSKQQPQPQPQPLQNHQRGTHVYEKTNEHGKGHRPSERHHYADVVDGSYVELTDSTYLNNTPKTPGGASPPQHPGEPINYEVLPPIVPEENTGQLPLEMRTPLDDDTYGNSDVSNAARASNPYANIQVQQSGPTVNDNPVSGSDYGDEYANLS